MDDGRSSDARAKDKLARASYWVCPDRYSPPVTAQVPTAKECSPPLSNASMAPAVLAPNSTPPESPRIIGAEGTISRLSPV